MRAAKPPLERKYVLVFRRIARISVACMAATVLWGVALWLLR